MRKIVSLRDEQIPRDADFHFRKRAGVLVAKWQELINAGSTGNGNGAAPASAPASASDARKPSEPLNGTDKDQKTPDEDKQADAVMEDEEATPGASDVVRRGAADVDGVAEAEPAPEAEEKAAKVDEGKDEEMGPAITGSVPKEGDDMEVDPVQMAGEEMMDQTEAVEMETKTAPNGAVADIEALAVEAAAS